jgi:hypothetical protein
MHEFIAFTIVHHFQEPSDDEIPRQLVAMHNHFTQAWLNEIRDTLSLGTGMLCIELAKSVT